MSVQLCISNYFESLTRDVDIYIEHLLSQANYLSLLSSTASFKVDLSEFSYSFNSTKKKAKTSDEQYNSEYTYNEEGKSGTNSVNNNGEQQRKRFKPSIEHRINEHRDKVLGVIKEAEKECYENYESIKNQVKYSSNDCLNEAKAEEIYGKLFAEKFYFVLDIPNNWNGLRAIENSNFNLLILLTDFYLNQADINLLKFLLFGKSPDSNKIDVCFDKKNLLILMLQRYILGLFDNCQIIDIVVRVNKKKLLSLEKVKFSEEISRVNVRKDETTLDFSNLKSLDLTDSSLSSHASVDLNGLMNLKSLSLSQFQIDSDSLKDLCKLSKLRLVSCQFGLSSLSAFPKLEVLEIKSSSIVDFNLDTSLYLNRLKSLTISTTFASASDPLIAFIRSLFNRLITLKLTSFDFSCSIFESLFSNITSSTLESLHIYSEKVLTKTTNSYLHARLENLKELGVHCPSLQHFYWTIFDKFPIGLERLDLSGNQISTNHILEHNNINVIMRHINTYYRELKYLNLAGNFYNTIEICALKNLSKLEVLDLSNMQRISLFRESFFGLCNLLRLDLSQNNLSSIDPVLFSYLPNLEDLNLSMNRIELVGRQFAHLGRLKRLDLSCNELRTINQDAFSNLSRLKELILCTNYLKKLRPQWFNDLQLVYLNLNDNLLEWNDFDLNELLTIRRHAEKIELLGNFAGERIGNLKPVLKYLKTDGFDLSSYYKDYYID